MPQQSQLSDVPYFCNVDYLEEEKITCVSLPKFTQFKGLNTHVFLNQVSFVDCER